MTSHLTPTERIVAWRMAEGRVVSADEIVHAIYGNRADGGALTANKVARLYAWRVRRFLSERGISVRTFTGFGWQVEDVDGLRDVLAAELMAAQ